MKFVMAAAFWLLAGSALARDAGVQVTDDPHYDDKGAYVTKTVHVGNLALTVRTDVINGRFGAGDMPTLVRQHDADGRDVAIMTETGDPVADIHLKENGHADKVTLGNGLKFMVVAQGKKAYKESLVGPSGKVLNERVIDPTTRRGAETIVLDPIAHDLGLSANWRKEIVIEGSGSTLTVKDKTGKVLLYVVREGPDSVGFDPAGKPLYYEVMAQFDFGHATNTADYGDLQALVPDRFIYTRDGRIGAYVWTPAVTAIVSFWTERDVSGATLIKYRSGEEAAPAAVTSLRHCRRPPPTRIHSLSMPCGGIFG